MKVSELKKIIKNGGATLNKSGESVHYSRGYQVSRRDCYTLDIKHTSKILHAINGLLKTVKPSEFIGLWVDNGLIYIDVYDAYRTA